MPITRRQFLYGTAGIGATALSSSLLAACGSSSSSTSSASKANDMWWFFNSPQNEQWFEKNIVDPFNVKQGHNSHINLIQKPQAIGQLQDTALAAGAGPDLLSTGGTNKVDLKYIVPLNDYAKKYGWEDRWLGWAWGNGFIGDKLAWLPAEFGTMLNFYNPATFSKYNWTPPQTKDEFEAICTEAAGRGIMPVAAGSADYAGGIDWFGTIFLNHVSGPEAMYQGLTGKIPFSDPVFVDAIALMQSYFQKGWFGGGVSNYFTNHVADLYTKLGNGQAAMQLTGTWGFTEIISYIGAAAHNTETWDWAAVPSLSSAVKPGTFALATGQSIAINAKCKNPDAAAAFMDSWFSKPATIASGLAAVNFPVPPIKFADSDFPSTTDPRVERLYLEVPKATAAGLTGYATWCFMGPKSEGYVQSDLPRVLTNALSPADFCKNLASIFNQEAAAGQVPAAGAPVSA
jgi:raffinose/stachyose/melibiose transport system substrate-binding protein